MDCLWVGVGAGGGRLWGGRAGPRPGLYMGGLRGRRAGRKGGHYTLNEFGASWRQGSVWRWVWLGMLGHYRGLRIGGRGRIAAGEVLVDGAADGIAPIGCAKGVDVFVLGEMDGLDEGLGKIGDGSGGARLDVAADDGGDETAEGGAEIVGGEVLTREEIGQFAGELIGGAGLGFFAGVVEAEVGMIGGAGSAALTAVGKGEAAQRHAIFNECGRRAANRAKRGHGWLQKVRFRLLIKSRPFEAQGKPALQKEKPRRKRGAILNDRIIWDELYDCQTKNWAKREEQRRSGGEAKRRAVWRKTKSELVAVKPKACGTRRVRLIDIFKAMPTAL